MKKHNTEAQIKTRVQANLLLAPQPTGKDRLAWRHLASFLAHVEQAAILHAQSGVGVPGQEDDEIVHKLTFEAMARTYGGLDEIRPEVQALLDFLAVQRGDLSAMLFNVICEGWIHGIFDRLAEDIDMFRVMEEEEGRHAKAPIRRFTVEEAEPHLRRVEELIADVANSPYFLVPLSHLLGIDEAAKLGLSNAANHRRTCAAIGLEPGSEIDQLEEKCRTALRAVERGLPAPVAMNAWQRSKMKVMKGHPWMMDSVVVPVGTSSPAELEALTMMRLGRILSRHPEMNRTIRGNQLYEPANITIGVRRGHDDRGDQIVTVYIQDPHLKSVPEIRQEIGEKLKKLKDRRYREVPDFDGLEDILPAPRASVVLTQTGQLGVRNGFAAPIDHEGASISVCLAKAEMKPFPREGLNTCFAGLGMFIGYTVDHRTMDGREIGALSEELLKEFKE